MAIRKATARWEGTLKEGKGTMKYGAVEGPFTFASRFEEAEGTNPEELAGAAHAGCFSMFLASLLTKAEHPPEEINTTATVELGKDDKGPLITSVKLETSAKVPGISDGDFQTQVKAAKEGCPISRLYAGTSIEVIAKLA